MFGDRAGQNVGTGFNNTLAGMLADVTSEAANTCAFGYAASAKGNNAVAIGTAVEASADATVIGANAIAGVKGIAIGSGAVASAAADGLSAQFAIGSAANPIGVASSGAVLPTAGASAGYLEIVLNGQRYRLELHAVE